MRCSNRYLYWVRNTQAMIKCLAPCENAIPTEKPPAVTKYSSARKITELISERKIQQHFIDLRFILDLDIDGNHVIELYSSKDYLAGNRLGAETINTISGSVNLNGVSLSIGIEGLEILRKMVSLNPSIKRGVLVYPFNLSTLQKLRSFVRVLESDRSKQILFKAISPFKTVEVDFDPSKGVTVRPVYANAEGQREESKHIERGNGYLKIDETFYLVDDSTQQVLDLEGKTIAIGDIPQFFLRDLVILKSNFTAVLTDEAKKISIKEEDIPPTILINYDEPGWLDFNIVYDPYNVQSGLPINTDGSFVRADDYSWLKKVDKRHQDDEQILKKLGASRTEKGYRLGLHSYKSLEDFIQQIGGVQEASEQYIEFLNQITEFQADEGYILPEKIESTLKKNGRDLFPYQRTGIQWLNWIFKHNLHGLLADDMGLGKTLQTLASMRCIYDENGSKEPSLIICPVAVIRHWENEIRTVFSRDTDVVIHHGQKREEARLHQKGKRTIFISSYDTVVADIAEMGKVPWFFVILDEGTKIKNPGTQRSAAIKQLNGAHKLSLSGTPIENRPAELWSLFDFLMRDHLGKYSEFLWRYEKPIMEGNQEQIDELKQRIKPFILRRKKSQVAPDLPEKIEMGYWVELTDEQKLIYMHIQESEIAPMREKILSGQRVGTIEHLLPVIMKLRQLCDHPAMINHQWAPALGRSQKFDLVIEKIQEIWEGGESCVVFTNFIGTLNLLEDQLKDLGLIYIRIDGQTQNRQELIDKFNSGGHAAALCSVLASGHGINLVAANHVIHVDNWFSPAVEDQATDRVHRIGQARTVYIHKILVENTLEEKIDALIKRKRKIINGIMDEELEGEKSWSREELLEILRPL